MRNICWAILLCWCALVPLARGEIHVGESLEWMVVDSDCIVRCRPVEIVDDLPTAGQPLQRVILAVSETFKGEPVDAVTVSADPRQASELTRWKDNGEERIVFLKRSDRRSPADNRVDPALAKYPYQLRGEWCLTQRFRKTKGEIALMVDSTIRRGDAIAAALRDLVAHPSTPTELPPLAEGDWFSGRVYGDRVKGIHVEASGDAFRELYSGSSCYLIVPIDERLHALARQWMTTGELSTGLPAIRYFKNDETIGFLREALNARSYWTQVNGPFDTAWGYHDRKLAYDTLRLWGVDVQRPALDMPRDAHRRVGGVACAMAVGVFASVVLAAMWARRRLLPEVTSSFRVVGASIDASSVILLVAAVSYCCAIAFDRVGIYEAQLCTNAAATRVWSDSHGVSMLRAPVQIEPIGLNVARFDLRSSPELHWDLQRAAIVRPSRAGFIWSTGAVQFQRGSTPVRVARVPRWAAAVVLFAAPVTRFSPLLLAIRRRRRRRDRGQCVACGYDLRGSLDRCPECGRQSNDVLASTASA